ncbi:hypothetical protein SHIRM173S_04639 [Streptomyces hirsutus]
MATTRPFPAAADAATAVSAPPSATPSASPAPLGAPVGASPHASRTAPVNGHPRHRLRAVAPDEVVTVADLLPPGATWLPAPQHTLPALPGHPPMVGYLVLVPPTSGRRSRWRSRAPEPAGTPARLPRPRPAPPTTPPPATTGGSGSTPCSAPPRWAGCGGSTPDRTGTGSARWDRSPRSAPGRRPTGALHGPLSSVHAGTPDPCHAAGPGTGGRVRGCEGRRARWNRPPSSGASKGLPRGLRDLGATGAGGARPGRRGAGWRCGSRWPPGGSWGRRPRGVGAGRWPSEVPPAV